MLLRVFTLRFNPATERFDDSLVEVFLADKEVLSIKDHFFIKDDVPYLALVVYYRVPALQPAARTVKSGKKRDESWRELLTEAVWPSNSKSRSPCWRRSPRGCPSWVFTSIRA